MPKDNQRPLVNAGAEMPGSGQSSRRDVLRNLTLAGLAVSSATAITASPAAAKPEEPTHNSLNYRETDHIRRYYALSRR